jgi:hypothetical protein
MLLVVATTSADSALVATPAGPVMIAQQGDLQVRETAFSVLNFKRLH